MDFEAEVCPAQRHQRQNKEHWVMIIGLAHRGERSGKNKSRVNRSKIVGRGAMHS